MATNKKGDVELVVSAKNEATQTINELIQTLEKLGKEAGGSGIAGFFQRLADSSGDLGKKQDELASALDRTRVAQKQLEKANAARERDLQKQRDAIDKTQQSLDKLNAEYEQMAQAAQRTREPTEALTKRFEQQQKRQQTLSKSIQETSVKLKAAQAEFDGNQGVDNTASANIESQRQKVLQLGQAWRETTRTIKEAKAVLAQRAQVRDNADTGQKEAQTRLNALREELKVAREVEKEKRKIVREAAEATDEEVKAKEKAIATTERLKKAVEEQVLVERAARESQKGATREYKAQAKEVDRLVQSADKQKTAYTELKTSLVDYEKAQKAASVDRQRANIEKLTASLEKLQSQYDAAAVRLRKTQEQMNKASGPDPQAVAKFEKLQVKIKDTEQAIREQSAVLEQMEREYHEAGASADQLAQKERELERVTKQVTREQKELESQTGKTANATRRAGNEASRANKQFRLWGDGSRQALSFLQRIRGELLAIGSAYVGIYAVGNSIRSIYDAAVTSEKATARLTARLGKDNKQIAEEMQFVSDTADRLGISYLNLLDQYTRFLAAVPEGELSLEQIRFSFEAVAEAARVTGASMADIQGIFTALSQLAGKGINLEDLRQQLQERIPGALEALRVGLSELEGQYVSTQEVLERINKSELSGAAIVPLALGLRRMFEKGLPVAVDSAQAALGRFNSELDRTELALAESGLLDQLVKGLKEVTAQMRTPEFKEGMQSFAKGMIAVIQFAVILIKNFDAVAAAIKAIIALKLAQYLTAVAIQLKAAAAAAAAAALQMTTAATAVGKLRAAVMLLLRGVLLLPAAFYAGFAIGDMIQRQFPIVRKAMAFLIGVIEKSIIRIGEQWDIFLAELKGGFLTTIKDITKEIITAIPAAIWTAAGAIGNLVGLLNESLGKEINSFAEASLESINRGVDKVLDGLIDTSETDAAIANIRKRADAEAKAVDDIITQMFADIEEQSKKTSVLDVDKAKKDTEQLKGELEDILNGLDYTRIGSNAGASVGDTLLTQFRNITRTLEEESADTLEKRLEVIRSEFDDFLKNLNEFDATTVEGIAELQKKEAAAIAAVRKRTGLSQEAQEKAIAAIRLRTESQVTKLRETQSSLAGARGVVNQLIAIRQEKERIEHADEQVEKAERRINDVIADRKDQQDKVNDMAELGLITAEEQGQRLAKINEESLQRLRDQLNEAKQVAQETGNTELAGFVDNFDNFEEIERRRAAVESLRRLEQQINDEYSIRDAKINTINTLRETGNLTAAEAEEKVKAELEASNAVLGQMIDKAIILAQTLGDEGMVARLQNMRAGLVQINKQVFDGAQLSSSFASGFTNAFSAFVQGTETASDAFRRFIADFLQMIADAILQAAILKAITGSWTGGGGGVGGAVANGLNAMFNHTGGVVGTDGVQKTVSPLAFLGALRYHSGGIAGLKPNEVPTILERGEEVLTRNDPRHVANGGGSPTELKVVNTIDSGSFVSEGMNTTVGQKAVMNFIKANKGRIKGVLG